MNQLSNNTQVSYSPRAIILKATNSVNESYRICSFATGSNCNLYFKEPGHDYYTQYDQS